MGVTFYNLLTKKYPFNSNDPMKLVYSHIAETPLSPNAIKPEIPKVISNIIMKLLSKTPENRYQTSLGIKTDLLKALNQLESRGIIDEFDIAQNDKSGKFQISQKLYGREQEKEILISLFRIGHNLNQVGRILI
jgi:serine/threonine protein kinase